MHSCWCIFYFCMIVCEFLKLLEIFHNFMRFLSIFYDFILFSSHWKTFSILFILFSFFFFHFSFLSGPPANFFTCRPDPPLFFSFSAGPFLFSPLSARYRPTSRFLFCFSFSINHSALDYLVEHQSWGWRLHGFLGLSSFWLIYKILWDCVHQLCMILSTSFHKLWSY